MLVSTFAAYHTVVGSLAAGPAVVLIVCGEAEEATPAQVDVLDVAFVSAEYAVPVKPP